MIDRVDVSTWAYDRIEGDNYKADNTRQERGHLLKSYAGEKQIRSGCTSTLEVTGPGFAKTVDSSGCDSYNPGTYVKVKSPGTYTATIRVHQDAAGLRRRTEFHHPALEATGQRFRGGQRPRPNAHRADGPSGRWGRTPIPRRRRRRSDRAHRRRRRWPLRVFARLRSAPSASAGGPRPACDR